MKLRSFALVGLLATVGAACGHPATPADAAADVIRRDVNDVVVTCGSGDPMMTCYVGVRGRACAMDQTFPPTCVENMWQCSGNYIPPSECGCTANPPSVGAGVECPCPTYGPPPNDHCPTDGGTGDAGGSDGAATDAPVVD